MDQESFKAKQAQASILNVTASPTASAASATTDIPPALILPPRFNNPRPEKKALKDLSKKELIRLVFRIGANNMEQANIITQQAEIIAGYRANKEPKP